MPTAFLYVKYAVYWYIGRAEVCWFRNEWFNTATDGTTVMFIISPLYRYWTFVLFVIIVSGAGRAHFCNAFCSAWAAYTSYEFLLSVSIGYPIVLTVAPW